MGCSKVDKACLFCGKIYKIKLSRFEKSKFCSRICADKNKRVGDIPLALIPKKRPVNYSGAYPSDESKYTRLGLALVCGHLTKKNRNYCYACRVEKFEKILKKCEQCGKEFSVRKSEKNKYKSCSMECRNNSISKRQLGDKSHLWKGGLTDESARVRNSADTDNWRKAVFKRDGYKCVICGNGGKICADHIKSFSLYPALRFDVDNGRTLCYPCHRKTDNFGYRALLEAKKYTNKIGQTQLGLI